MSVRAQKAHAKFCENVERFRELLRLWKDEECLLLEKPLGKWGAVFCHLTSPLPVPALEKHRLLGGY